MPQDALSTFEEMHRRGIWQSGDVTTANILLDALSGDASAAFSKYRLPIMTPLSVPVSP